MERGAEGEQPPLSIELRSRTTGRSSCSACSNVQLVPPTVQDSLERKRIFSCKEPRNTSTWFHQRREFASAQNSAEQFLLLLRLMGENDFS